MKRATWFFLLSCVTALIFGVVFDVGPARARPGPAGAAPPGSVAAASVHGLAPLPGDAPVPLVDRPPGAEAGRGPSPGIFPPQRLTIRFNHKKHVRQLGIVCTGCHDAARTSKSSKDRLLPPPTRCDACHGSDHRNLDAVTSNADELIGQCAFCHVGYDPKSGARVERLSIPTPNLKMNHAAHLARNIACAQCHGQVDTIELATRDQLPRMRGCLKCHQMSGPAAGKARGACYNCHLTERGGLMKTAFASGKLVPPRWLHDSGHGPDWILRHREVAGNDSRFCSSCHSEKDCTDCHDGRVRPRNVHPNDWISMHPTAARQNSPRCTSCHRTQSFCVSCHQRAGVTLSGPYGAFAGRGRFHPPKSVWTDPPRTAGHHAWEAQRNIEACVSCHVERDCAICHASARVGGRGLSGTQGQGTNPHPSDFRSRCRTALRKNARPCLVCHDPADPQLLECR